MRFPSFCISKKMSTMLERGCWRQCHRLGNISQAIHSCRAQSNPYRPTATLMVSSLAKTLFTVKGPDEVDRSQSAYRSAKRIQISVDTMKGAGLGAGDLMMIKPVLRTEDLENLGTSQDDTKTTAATSRNRFGIGIAWPLMTNERESVKTGDLVNITQLPPILPLDHRGPGRGIRLPEAHSLELEEVDPTRLDCLYGEQIIHQLESDPKRISMSFTPKENRLWEGFVREVLVHRKYFALKHYVSIPSVNGSRYFCVTDIQAPSQLNSANTNAPELFVVTRKIRLKINSLPTITHVISIEGPVLDTANSIASSSAMIPGSLNNKIRDDVGYAAIGGLDAQVAQIRELIELPLTRPELYSHFGLTPPRGILLYGPPGTGKTLLASIVARSTKSTLLTMSASNISSAYHGEAEQKIYDIFAEAKSKSPSIIVIDEIDGLFPNRDQGGEVDRRVVGAMLSCMDGIDEKYDTHAVNQGSQPRRVVVLATTNRPNSLDPALRRPGRFDRELEIGMPDASNRLQILQVFLRSAPHNLTADELKSYADKSHGFVGADLGCLIRTAGLSAISRSISNTASTPVSEMRIESIDVDSAFLTVRPSAMREVFIETPKVKWADIGGQEVIKQKLRESVEWPIKYADTFKRLGINPTRGVLLYGPPGCSKTLIAKALASESGLNFISIKGSDVFNKYVGESEKSIRDLFRKARAASPSVVFLDEIDTIAMSRSSDEGGGGGSTGDRVLTSLLTEIDGIEELKGVLVLAATNRPDVIDAALMRPGRLDRILYVGPPDKSSREEILKINFRKMAVSKDIDISDLAQRTEGCTGAEIVSICQDAAINAMHRDLQAEFITQDDLIKAINQVRRRTTIEVIKMYEEWRDRSGVQSV